MKRFLVAATLVLAVGLAGCSGGSAADPTDSSGAVGGAGQQDGRGGPGGSGKVVEVSGSTAQVQGNDAQVAVTWSDATTFSQQVEATVDVVEVGSCVMVQSGGTSADSDELTAANVRVTPATDDGCSIGAGGRTGGPQGGDTPPSGVPSGAPDRGEADPGDGPAGGAGRTAGAFGEVTAVSDTGFTVSSMQPGQDDASDVAVTTTADTTYTATTAATADDVTVGSCVTSLGDADDTGAITADSIAVSQPVDDACGFGGLGSRGQGSE